MITIHVLASSSAGNAYALTSSMDPQLVLIECGIPMKKLRSRLFDCGLSVVNARVCLISHEHGDHARAFKDMRWFSGMCEVASGARTLDVLGRKPTDTHLVDLVHGVLAKFGRWSVLPFDVIHDAVQPMGFIVSDGEERVLYVTDTRYIEYQVGAINHYMIEANFADDLLDPDSPRARRVSENHLSIDQAKALLQANDLTKCRAIHLLHLSSAHSDAERFRREVEELTGIPTYVAAER